MSGFKFEIDKAGLSNVLNDATRKVATNLQRDLRAVGRTHKGKSVAAIKPHLRAAFKKNGWDATDRELTKYAQLVSQGVEIEVKPDQVQL